MKTYFTSLGIALLISTQVLAEQVYLTQTTSQVPIEFGGVQCGYIETAVNAGNQYFRIYNLAEYGIINSFEVTQVEFGVGWALAGLSAGEQPVEINIYTLAGPLLYENLTLISTTQFMLPDQDLSLYAATVNPTLIPPGSIMAIEIVIAAGDEFDGNIFMIGANSLGQTHPCYLAADLCGLPEPIELGLIGFPDEHSIINVYGESEGILHVPVANWAIFLAIGLMVILTGIIIRRKIA